ncbi:MAG TPA: glycosyltransferase family 25 protein [Parachlamydiaceae bacterium]|nr:glycosyltransferase family 25 protein [Parachlamydiaceae bacterium]
MIKLMTLFLLASCGSMFGELDSYFKKITVRPTTCQIRNIDFIYMINLDQRPEKYDHTMEELAPFGISPYRFSAVNGWELSLEDINQIGIKYEPWMRADLMGTCYLPEEDGIARHEIMHVPERNYFCHCMSRGAIGIALSHLSILQDAYNNGYETIWVLEDDIEVIKDPHLLSDLIEKLDRQVGRKGWDFLFTDQDTKSQNGSYVPCTAAALKPTFNPINPDKFQERIDISQDFRKIGARYGAYSVIVSRSGMKKMLEFTKNGIFLPYDMEYTLPDNIQMYNVRDDIVSTQPQAFSDNGAPNYKQALLQ